MFARKTRLRFTTELSTIRNRIYGDGDKISSKSLPRVHIKLQYMHSICGMGETHRLSSIYVRVFCSCNSGFVSIGQSSVVILWVSFVFMQSAFLAVDEHVGNACFTLFLLLLLLFRCKCTLEKAKAIYLCVCESVFYRFFLLSPSPPNSNVSLFWMCFSKPQPCFSHCNLRRGSFFLSRSAKALHDITY